MKPPLHHACLDQNNSSVCESEGAKLCYLKTEKVNTKGGIVWYGLTYPCTSSFSKDRSTAESSLLVHPYYHSQPATYMHANNESSSKNSLMNFASRFHTISGTKIPDLSQVEWCFSTIYGVALAKSALLYADYYILA